MKKIFFFIILQLFFISETNAAEIIDDAKIFKIGLINTNDSNQSIREIYHDYTRSYLEEITKSTNWIFEYENGSLEECRDKLLNGELDLIGPVRRDDNNDFIYSVGNVGYGIFSIYCSNEKEISGTAEDVNGMKVGMVEDTEVEKFLMFALNQMNWKVTVEKFKIYSELMTAFRNGTIDLIVDDGSHVTNEKILSPIGQAPENFISTPSRLQMMKEFNHAVLQSEILYPFFLNRLRSKYLYPVLQKMSPYREHEKNFIAESPALKIGFLPAQMPLYDTKNSRGIYIDYLNLISKESGLKFELKEAKTEQELGEMIWSGKVDAAFVIYSPGKYHSTTFFTNEIDRELFVTIISRENINKEIPKNAKVALIHTFNGVQSYFKKNYPEYTLNFYDDVEKCLKSVERDECDVAYIPAGIICRENSMVTHPSLTTSDEFNFHLSICFAISQIHSRVLQEVLNTAILHLSQKQIDMIAQKNSEPIVSMNYVLATYPLPLAMAITIVTGTFIFSIAFYLRGRSRKKQNEILLEKNMELETALRAVENMRVDRDNYRSAAERDKLTQLYNKTAAERIANEMIKEIDDEKSAVLYVIDLDHFKEANDTFGHQYGDRILVEFSVTLRHIFRANDCVGRFGGDEFVVILTGFFNEEIIFRKANQIQQAAKNIDIDKKIVNVTASIGIATAPNHGRDYESLFKQADRALYCVKADGRDGYCLNPPEVFH